MMLKHILELMVVLTDRVRSYKAKYENTPFKESPFNDDYFPIIYGKDDGADTDIHTCVESEQGLEMKFYVAVDPETDKIVNVGLDCVDVIADGQIYDCINIETLY